MTDTCLNCADIQEQICILLADISNMEGCQGAVMEESGIRADYTEQIKAKYKALDVLEKLEERKCPKGELYEFTHAVCTYPVNCGSGCSPTRNQSRNRRRYR